MISLIFYVIISGKVICWYIYLSTLLMGHGTEDTKYLTLEMVQATIIITPDSPDTMNPGH